ncbi:MAG TPA: hypothetical protein VGU90_08205, partial [Terriglobales bacterium]|nr:hypothetical protein [Terriglobales bacterium]
MPDTSFYQARGKGFRAAEINPGPQAGAIVAELRLPSVPFTFTLKISKIRIFMPEDQQNRDRMGSNRSAAVDKGEVTLTAAIRRYFDVGLYLMIFTGFGTLASTGRLDLPTVVLVTGALLYRGYALSRRWRKALLSERWTNLLTIGCVAYFIADEFLISRTFLAATVHLVLFVMLVRLFSAQRDRDHYLL